MPYQYKCEPLTLDETNRLGNACQTHEEKLVVWSPLGSDLRVLELAHPTKDNLDWQAHCVMVYGKRGPYRSASKRRIIPSVQHPPEGNILLHDGTCISSRSIQRVIKRAGVPGEVVEVGE